MANNNSLNNNGPGTAPQHHRWYNLSLGSSFRDNSSRFCTLRYEFKPASIDKTQPGLLHKNKENRVSVEFHNNQAGKPKVTFEGSSEEYKENDAVLFFDGESFRLEQLHRAVKRLRHVRLPGDTTAPTTSAVMPAMESYPSPVGKAAKFQSSSREPEQPLFVEVERIEMGLPEGLGEKSVKTTEVAASSQEEGATIMHEEEDDDEDDDESMDIATVVDAVCSEKDEVTATAATKSDHNDDDDDDIADICGGDDDGRPSTGLNAAEALARAAPVNAGSSSGSDGSDSDSSSSSSSSSSESSDSSDSDTSDSVNSI